MKKLILILSAVLFLSSSAYADLKIYFIDVGQGDSEYLELPNHKTALVDAGPDQAHIAAFFRQHNISHVNFVVLTHPHSDHYTGLNYVFAHCQVDNFYDTKMDNTTANGSRTIRRKIRFSGCTIHYPKTGDLLDWDPQVSVKVLNAHPEYASSSDGTVLNEASIVLHIIYNHQAIMLTGDIDTIVEAEILSHFPAEDIISEVLKVAHHGSRYTSSLPFLKEVKPQYAYIEVGADNRYGHPHNEALDRLTQVGATVYRTDLKGTMEYNLR